MNDPIMDRANFLAAQEAAAQQSLAKAPVMPNYSDASFGPPQEPYSWQPPGPPAGVQVPTMPLTQEQRFRQAFAQPPQVPPAPVQGGIYVPGQIGPDALPPSPPPAPPMSQLDQLVAANQAYRQAHPQPVISGPMIRAKAQKSLQDEAGMVDKIQGLTGPVKPAKGAAAAVRAADAARINDTAPMQADRQAAHSFDDRSEAEHTAPRALTESKFGPQARADTNDFSTKSLSDTAQGLRIALRRKQEDQGEPPRKSYRWKQPGWEPAE